MRGIHSFLNEQVAQIVASRVFWRLASAQVTHHMLLQGLASATAKLQIVTLVIGQDFFCTLVRLEIKLGIAIEPQDPMLTFKPHLAERAAWVVGYMIIQAVAIKASRKAVVKFKNDVACVLTNNMGV